MKTIKTGTVLKNFNGDNLKNGDEDLTIGFVISNVLGGKVSNPTLGWILGKKFATEKEVDLKAEEMVFIKEELKKPETNWLAITTGQVLEILEAKDEKDEKKK